MPLSIPLAELRYDLGEKELPDALYALLALLPDGSEKHRIVFALIDRFKTVNKVQQFGTIKIEEYLRLIAQIRADFSSLVVGLSEDDFDAATAEKGSASAKAMAAKQGSVLYRIPHIMPLQKPTRCIVRVAISEEAILENIEFDEHVQPPRRIEVSNVMSAELVDPDGGIFEIRTDPKSTTQLVRDTGYTEWIFSVTPLREGVHQLLVKVSILEIVPGFADPIPRDLPFMETITIVTENLAPADTDDVPMKSAGEIFVFHSTSTADYSEEIGRSPRRWRILVTVLTSLALILAVTWLSMPEPTRGWYAARLKDDATTYQAYIDKHKRYHGNANIPFGTSTAERFVEEATFRKAVKTEQPKDYLTYLEDYKENGQFQIEAQQALEELEIKHLQGIRENPTLPEVRQFLVDFPTSERLPELKNAVETRPELAAEVLPDLETFYVYAVQETQNPQRVRQFLSDFPESEKLADVTKIVMGNPSLALVVQPELEDVYLRKIEQKIYQGDQHLGWEPQQSPSRDIEEFLHYFPIPVRKEKLEQILEKNPKLKKEFLRRIRTTEKQENVGEIDRQKQAPAIRKQEETHSISQTPIPIIYPSVSATNITQTSASLNGIVNPNGVSTIAWFMTPISEDMLYYQIIGSGKSKVKLSSYQATGLTPGTTYSFRVVAATHSDTIYSNWILFTTLGTSPFKRASTPGLHSFTVTNITKTSVTLNAIFYPYGTANAKGWFEDPNGKKIGIQNIGRGSTPVGFSYTINGLIPGKDYSFRAVADNSTGLSSITYSAWKSFRTLTYSNSERGSRSPSILAPRSPDIYPPPSVTNITQTSVSLNGFVNPNGATTNAWFTTSKGEQLQFQNIGSGNSPITLTPFTLTGLIPGTYYSISVVATNSVGYTTGPWISFTTLGVDQPRRSGFEMVLVEGGTYTMGSSITKKDQIPQECPHPVTVASFSIGKYEVTQADWREIMEPGRYFNDCVDCPVGNVTWDEIQDFLKKVNEMLPAGQKKYRLLTEEEWEYAARGGNRSMGYKYAGGNDLEKVAWYKSNSNNKTHPVGDLVPNELGIYDMSGNIVEWCQDQYKPYPGCIKLDAILKYRILRGGSYVYPETDLRLTDRNYSESSTRAANYGFRLAQD